MSIKGENLFNNLEKKGFHYPKELLFNYLMALSTKPFVILTGISGSGKSKIAELIAEELSSNGIKNFELIPVKPNWKDSKGIFGYHNIIDNSYYITPAISLFLKALKNPTIPFFLILDEMNMAKTEQYFADYLSLIESRRYSLSEESLFSFENGQIIYKKKISLSDAIILSALDINKPTELLAIEDYRMNRFSVAWQDQIYGGENWTAQYRSELNQGDGRLAHRVFEGGDGHYKLKPIEDITNTQDKERIELLRKVYIEQKDKKNEIVQQNIKLHNCCKCINSSGKQCDQTCTLSDSNKFMCPHLTDQGDDFFIPSELPIPLNVFTIGTVNIDETTNMFSPKVLDRCNIIEFNDVDFSGLYSLPDSIKEIIKDSERKQDNDFFFDADKNFELKISIPAKFDVDTFVSLSENTAKNLFSVFAVLRKYNLHFGYRVMNEISAYLCNVNNFTAYESKFEVGLDKQIYQKILPKMFGNYDKLWKPLTEILDVLSSNQSINYASFNDWESINNVISAGDFNSLFSYPQSAQKICSMLYDLDNSGFTSFIK